ncbi:MAG: hypothetical protein JWN36_2825 [Microbacteriaceae bacterium]|nr:hypothetical protein [Microbacteriaceae bacterium]
MDDMARFRDAAVVWAAAGPGADAAAGVARTLAGRVRTVILVEGPSDAVAVEALAARSGRDFPGERVAVVPVGGATAVRRFLEPFGPRGLDLRLAGLVDAAEERFYRQAVQGSDRHPELTRDEMEQLGFFVCVADLEDELIRAIGTERVIEVVAGEGQAKALRTFRNQPAQRERTLEQQLHRFMGTMSGRKSRYAAALAGVVELDRIPRPIAGLLRFV